MWMSQSDHENFDRELLAGNPQAVSRGTKSLMAVMGVRAPKAPMSRPPNNEGGNS